MQSSNATETIESPVKTWRAIAPIDECAAYAEETFAGNVSADIVCVSLNRATDFDFHLTLEIDQSAILGRVAEWGPCGLVR
jgi:hypothetical protein